MLLTSVIGHKISRDGMTSARPESIAFTAIIPRLPSNHRISQRRELVLQKKLCLSCTGSLGKTFEPISPLGRRVSDLVMDRKKSGLNVDSRSCETLSYKQSIAFVAIERHDRCIFWDGKPLKPVYGQLILCRRWFYRPWTRTDLGTTDWDEQHKDQTASPPNWSRR